MSQSKLMDDFGLYVILTQPELPYQEVARICVDLDVRFLQLREKGLTDRELLTIADDVLAITEGTATNFIFNDRFDLALASGSDGVHLGQDDTPVSIAKQFLPDRSLIGLSTHSIDQVEESMTLTPDYIGFGPVYETPTKAKPDPVVGLSNLTHAINLSDVPVVAIGGINLSNLDTVIRAGARNVAMVRELIHTKATAKRITLAQKRLRHASQVL